MLALLLAASSSLSFGAGDFLGGLQSRRLATTTVVLWSQLAGGVALLLALAIRQQPVHTPAIIWGGLAGVVGCGGLLLFYRGLALGAMSIVAPVSACGAVVPVAVALARGSVPGNLALVGIAVALTGTVLVSLPSGHVPHPSGRHGQVLLLALGAAVCFGLFFTLLAQGATAVSGSSLATVACARGSSILTLLVVLGLGRRTAPLPRRRLPQLVAVGLLDSGGNLLFALSSTHGNLGVVGVVASLYPVVTVVLAGVVLAERLNAVQWAGVLCALCGVTLISTG